MDTVSQKGKLDVNLYVSLGKAWQGPIEFTIYKHLTPSTMLSCQMDDILELPVEMRTKSQRGLFWYEGGRFIEKSYGSEGVQNNDTLVLTDILDPQTVVGLADIFIKSSPPKHKIQTVQQNLTGRSNPWISGSFYLFAVALVITLLAFLSNKVDILVLPIVLICGLLAVTIIGAFQLRNDDRLQEESFIKLMLETLKRLPLLRKGKD